MEKPTNAGISVNIYGDKIYNEKKRLRILYKKIRRVILDKAEQSRQICDKLISLPEFRFAKNILLYYPLADEVDIKPLFTFCRKNQINVFLPIYDNINIGIANSFEGLSNGKFGLKEPKISTVLDQLDIDIIIIPGIAFDKKGYRLGYGSGWYDRFLSKYGQKEKALTIGVCFKEQLVEDLPHEDHDIKVDRVIFNLLLITN